MSLLPPAGASTACSPFKPVRPGEDSYSEQKERALKGRVVRVTDASSAKEPLTIEYEQGPGLYAVYDPVVEDTRFFNIQIDSTRKHPKLTIKQEWGWPSPSDFDLLVFGAYGQRVADSQNLSTLPGPDPWNPNAGPGYEMVKRLSVKTCDGYTIESKGFFTPGATLQLKIWIE